MYGCESCTIKKAEHQRIDAFELWCLIDSWESLGQQGDPPVHPKGDQSWIFIGRTDAKAGTPIIWLPHAKSWLIGKDPDAGDWGREEKVMTEDKMTGWHHRLDGHEFEWTWSWWWTGRPGVLQFMGSQRVRHDWATELNWTEYLKTQRTLEGG